MTYPSRIWLFANLCSIICASGAVAAICMGVGDGWGWLLFMAAITHSSVKSAGSSDRDDEEGMLP